jgi:hypothetical protein
MTRESDMLEAFLVAKQLRYSPGTHLVCAVVVKRGSPRDIPEQLRRQALLPANATIRLLNRHDQPLKAALEVVTGARIYARRDVGRRQSSYASS